MIRLPKRAAILERLVLPLGNLRSVPRQEKMVDKQFFIDITQVFVIKSRFAYVMFPLKIFDIIILKLPSVSLRFKKP